MKRHTLEHFKFNRLKLNNTCHDTVVYTLARRLRGPLFESHHTNNAFNHVSFFITMEEIVQKFSFVNASKQKKKKEMEVERRFNPTTSACGKNKMLCTIIMTDYERKRVCFLILKKSTTQ
jgi:hypothetical protein